MFPFHTASTEASHPSHATPDRFIPGRRSSDVDAAHYKLLRRRSCSLSGQGNMSDSPATPEEKAYARRLSLISGGRSEGSVLNSTMGSNSPRECFESPVKQRPMPKSPDEALQMEDIPDDLYTNILSWSSKNELAVALLKTVYIWSGETCQHRNIPWEKGSTAPPSHRLSARRGSYSTPPLPIRRRRAQANDSDAESDEDDGYVVGEGPDVAEASAVVCSLAWSTHGRYLALGMEDGTVRTWDSLQVGHVPQVMNREQRCPPPNNAANAVCWGPKHTIYSGHQCGCVLEVTLQKSATATHRDTIIELNSSVSNITVSPHKRYLAVSSMKELITLHMPDKAACWRMQLAGDECIKGVVFLPWHGDVLAYSTCSMEEGHLSRITLYHVPSESVLAKVGSESQIYSLAVNKESRELISGHGGKENCICIWTAQDLQLVGKLPGHNCKVLHIAVSPDSTKLASCGPDQLLKFWSCFDVASVKTGSLRRRVMSSTAAADENADPFTTRVPPKAAVNPNRAATKRRASMPIIQSPLLGQSLR